MLTVLVVAAATLVAGPAPAEPEGVPVTTDRAGQVVAWGNNDDGQTAIPDEVADEQVTAIAAGYRHSLAITADGRLHAWGFNGSGQISIPAEVADAEVTAIAAGEYHSLAITADGQLHAWGSNGDGQTSIPAEVADAEVTAIAGGAFHSLAITADGRLHAWGDNNVGQGVVPDALANAEVIAIAAGGFHSLAITADGHLHAWGFNGTGQISIPAAVADAEVTAIAAGDYHSLAITADGHLHAWGYNGNGQTTIPAAVADAKVVAISAGDYHSLAVTADGLVHAWGLNDSGQATVPVELDEAEDLVEERVTAVSAGHYHSMVVLALRPPALSLEASRTSLRRGQSTKLTWTTARAVRVAASGAWNGLQDLNGSAVLRPTELGASSSALTATGPNGARTTARVKITVTRPPIRLRVKVADGRTHAAGTKILLRVRGLDRREPYTVRKDNKKVKAGRTRFAGANPIRLTLPRTLKPSRHALTVTGSEPDRTGTTTLRTTRR